MEAIKEGSPLNFEVKSAGQNIPGSALIIQLPEGGMA
jgi:hypothetical protein